MQYSLCLFSQGPHIKTGLELAVMPCWGLTMSLVPGGTGPACELGARLKPPCSGYYITETRRASPHTEQLAAVNHAQLGTAGKEDRTPKGPGFRCWETQGQYTWPRGMSSHEGEANQAHLTLVTASNGYVAAGSFPTPKSRRVRPEPPEKEKMAGFCCCSLSLSFLLF